VRTGTVGSLEEVLFGPAQTDDGTTNVFGGLRRAMAMSGYSSIKEFQKVEVMVAPTEGRRGAP
jgi:IMP dehydrogenase